MHGIAVQDKMNIMYWNIVKNNYTLKNMLFKKKFLSSTNLVGSKPTFALKDDEIKNVKSKHGNTVNIKKE